MEMHHIEVVLANAKDILYAEDGNLPKQKVRQISTRMRIDNKVPFLSISHEARAKLGLKEKRKIKIALPNSKAQELSIVGPLEVYFENQNCTVDALVLPEGFEPIFGAIPMQYMDIGLVSEK